jgi:predicted membrane chloride channel (bestrophin family)
VSTQDRRDFWREAFALHGSVTPRVFPEVLGFGAFAAVVWGLAWLIDRRFQVWIGLEVAPFEIAGAVGVR